MSISPPPIDNDATASCSSSSAAALSPEEMRQSAVDAVTNSMEQWAQSVTAHINNGSNDGDSGGDEACEDAEDYRIRHLPVLDLSYNDMKYPDDETQSLYPASEWIPALAAIAKRVAAEIRQAPTGTGTGTGDDAKLLLLLRGGGTRINISGTPLVVSPPAGNGGTAEVELFCREFLQVILPLCKPDGPHLELNLENTRLTPKAATIILKTVKALLTTTTTASAGSNDDNDDGKKQRRKERAGSNVSSGNTAVTSCLHTLNLRENALRCDTMPDVASLIAASPHLEVLHLGSCFIFPEGAAVLASQGLARCSRHALRVLSLNYNTLGDDGVVSVCEALSCASRLERLNLSETVCGDRGAAAVVKHLLPPDRCGPLVYLDLSCNKIGKVGATALASALAGGAYHSAANDGDAQALQLPPLCSVLEELDLGNNPTIGDEGGLALAAASALAPRLRVIDFTCCDLPPEAGPVLERAMAARPASFFEAAMYGNPRVEKPHLEALWRMRTERKKLRLPPRSKNEPAPSGTPLLQPGTPQSSDSWFNLSPAMMAAVAAAVAVFSFYAWRRRAMDRDR